MSKTSDDTELALKLMDRADRMAVLSGAGISTEAGIPDFRGPGGLWQDPSLFAKLSAKGFAKDPAGFYEAGLKLFPNIAQAKPTPAHYLVAGLEQRGRIVAVVTQNIDGLHQAAGSRKVFEIHGTFRTGHCTRCRKSYEMLGFYEDMRRGLSLPPLCACCSKPIKPDLVLFDDYLPAQIWQAAVEAVEDCDLLLVLGSSLRVYPAAGLPQLALEHGMPVVIVNLEETPYDSRAAAVVRGSLAEFAQAANLYQS